METNLMNNYELFEFLWHITVDDDIKSEIDSILNFRESYYEQEKLAKKHK